MNNKTFGIVVGVIIALALAMFAGLYMLGLSSDGGTFNNGYEYNYNDTTTLYPSDNGQDAGYYDTSTGDTGNSDFYYQDNAGNTTDTGNSDFYFDENGNAYNFNDYQVE